MKPAVLADYLVFAGASRSAYFERAIDAVALRGDAEGGLHMQQLASLPLELTPAMSRRFPSFAAEYCTLSSRATNHLLSRLINVN